MAMLRQATVQQRHAIRIFRGAALPEVKGANQVTKPIREAIDEFEFQNDRCPQTTMGFRIRVLSLNVGLNSERTMRSMVTRAEFSANGK